MMHYALYIYIHGIVIWFDNREAFDDAGPLCNALSSNQSGKDEIVYQESMWENNVNHKKNQDNVTSSSATYHTTNVTSCSTACHTRNVTSSSATYHTTNVTPGKTYHTANVTPGKTYHTANVTSPGKTYHTTNVAYSGTAYHTTNVT